MKLKRMLSGVMAAVMAVTSSVVMTVSANADAANPVMGIETVVGTFTLDEANTTLPQYWPLCEVSLDVEDQSIFTDGNHYVKVTMSYETAPTFGDDSAPFSTLAGWGWGNYSWANIGGWFATSDAETGANLVPATTSSDNVMYCYFPASDFTAGTAITGYIKNYMTSTAVLESVELIKFAEYDKVNQWVDNGDTTFYYICAKTDSDTDQYNGTPVELEGYDISGLLPEGKSLTDATSIDVLVDFKSGYAGAQLGMNVYEDATQTTTTWAQVDYDNTCDVVSIDMPYGAPADSTLKFGLSWINYDTTIVLDFDFVFPSFDIEDATAADANGSITIDVAEAAEGDTVTITATPDENYEVDEITVATADGTVDVEAATAANTYTFTMPAEAVTVTATFKSTLVPATSVTLSNTTAELVIGKTTELTATVAPENTTDTVAWTTSDAKVATVADGVVTAVGTGTATITATAGEKSATCTVTVTNPATKVTVAESAEIVIGTSETLTATVTATDTSADCTDAVEWTAAPEGIVAVDNGKVTATGVGTATITVTAGTASATCKVTVTNPATAIALTKVVTLVEGKTTTLTPSITYADANATKEEVTVTWKSSDTSIATVLDGLVTAIKAGTATITATAGDLSATATINVTTQEIAATGVVVAPTEATIAVGKTQQIEATLTPEDTTDELTWTSSDEKVATVDANGVVTAVKAGTATITATANDKVSAVCNVTVVQLVTNITLTAASATVTEGETVAVTAVVSPADATNAALTWSSSDTDIATVDADGVVTAKAAGDVTITAAAKDDSGVTASVNIKVTAIEVDDVETEETEETEQTEETAEPEVPAEPEEPEETDEPLAEGTYSDGTYAELAPDEIPAMVFGGAEDVETETFRADKNKTNTSFNNGKLYIFKQVAEADLAGIENASVVVQYKSGKALKLTSACAYTSLNADVKADDGYVYVAFVISDISDVDTNALYFGNFAWTDITLA